MRYSTSRRDFSKFGSHYLMTRWTHIIILTITIGMVVDPFTPAQNTSGQVGLTLVGQLVGDVTSIVVDGSLAYAVLTQGQGQELVVLDV